MWPVSPGPSKVRFEAVTAAERSVTNDLGARYGVSVAARARVVYRYDALPVPAYRAFLGEAMRRQALFDAFDLELPRPHDRTVQGQNLIVNSQAMDLQPESFGNVTITPDSFTAPDGTATADLVDDQDAGQFGSVGQSIAVPATDRRDYVVSAFLRKDTDQTRIAGLQLAATDVVIPGLMQNSTVAVNTETGAIAPQQNATPSQIGIVDHDANWWRVWASLRSGLRPEQTLLRFLVLPALSTGSDPSAPISSSATGSAVYWGVQVERGQVPGPYCPVELPLVAWPQQTGRRLFTSGWVPNQGRVLARGDMFQLRANPEALQLYTMREDAIVDAQGAAELLFDPPLRAPAVNGERIFTQSLAIRVRLDDGQRVPGPQIAGPVPLNAEFAFREA